MLFVTGLENELEKRVRQAQVLFLHWIFLNQTTVSTLQI
jgi:hypothetical protein